MKPCDKNINQTLELVQAMVDLAETGESTSEDDNCRILYNRQLDSANEIKQIAEAEKEKDIRMTPWIS